jgi:uncharacterized protein YkwD
MTNKSSFFQRVSAIALIAALGTPLSVSAENRTPRRTSIAGLASDLERALGRGSVEVRRGPTASPRAASLTAQALVDAMNRQRSAYGLGPLRLNNRLSLAANDRIDDMLSKRYFDHISPDGVNPFTWVAKRGYQYSVIGENLAVGYPTAERVVTGWMNSPGHRANILKTEFDEIGIAFDSSAPLRQYAGPLVVAMYGTR